ncbi:MAG TPA: AAA family ATPase [Holosporales bacterium]|nr:AAA family ATPase [Holosporales bacterium]
MSQLFQSPTLSSTQIPLAETMRPQCLEDIIGQEHLLKQGAPLDTILSSAKSSGSLPSLILWGPPGCGKTTLAKLISKTLNNSGKIHFDFVSLSAVLSGVGELRKVFEQAQSAAEQGHRTILFVDEIHRFNRAQQDSFLAHLEDGRIILIGATTENPSFELNGALLSRTQVFTLKPLKEDSLKTLLEKAEKHLKNPLSLTQKAPDVLLSLADGDGRYFLNLVEIIVQHKTKKDLSPEDLSKLLQKRRPLYDKSQDGHYNLISALHKSLRGSDPDAGLYWFNRILQGGEDPKYILRRLIRFAVEDVSLADPNALLQATSAQSAYTTLGSPEGDLAIAQLVVYLATAPKSNAVYKAQKEASKLARNSGSLMPPKTILNAPTKLMENEGYGKGYVYDHDTPQGFSGQSYFPEEITTRPLFYEPVERGFERDLKKRLEYWKKIRQSHSG